MTVFSRITQGPFDPEIIQSEYSIQDEEIKVNLSQTYSSDHLILHKPDIHALKFFIITTELNKVLLSKIRVVSRFLCKLSSLALLNSVTPPSPVNESS